MNTTMENRMRRACRRWAIAPLLLLGCACGALRPTTTSPPAVFSLDLAQPTTPATASATAPILIINPTRASSGFDSPRMIYVRDPHKLEYFAHSVWVDPPARMLTPLIVAVVGNPGGFRAAVSTPSAADGDFRLDTQIIRLQQEFQTRPSRVRFTLRAYLVEERTRRVLAWHEFEAAVPATREDPYGGVVAANLAVQTVLEQLAVFCADAAGMARREK